MHFKRKTVLLLKLLAKNIMRYYSKYKFYSVIYFISVVFDMALEGFISLSFKYLLDNVLGPHNRTVMILVLTLLVTGVVVSNIGYTIRTYLYSKLCSGILQNIRNELFDQIQKLSMNYFNRTKPGEVLAHFSTDLSSIEYLITMAIPVGLNSFIKILINMALVLSLNWKLSLISILCLVLCLLGPYLLSKKVSVLNTSLKGSQGELISELEENIGAQHLIKSFSIQETVKKLFKISTGRLYGVTAKTLFFNDLMVLVPNVIISVFNVLLICVGVIFAFNGYMSAGALVSFNSLFLGLSTSVGCFAWVLPAIMQASASVKQMQDFLDETPQIKDDERAINIENFEKSIDFENVDFSYTGSKLNLEGINLSIKKGASVAFVGTSGSGKSSILNLIMRLYDPAAGIIKIDGKDLKTISQKSLHTLTSIVLQENVLFKTTIEENFRMVNPKATDEDIIEAAKLAEIHEYIMSLKEGYKTVSGDNEGRFSGGQRQRLAIARALVCDPQILILDEATSALDPGTEEAINSSLMKIAEKRTIISITHRLAGIKDYDYIYVMDKGHLVEQGTHRELIEKEGLYASMVRKQGGFVIDADSMSATIEADRLKDIPIFKKLENGILEELAEMFVSEYYTAGKNIIEEGDNGDRFYIIARGKVDVVKLQPDGSEKIVNFLEDGDYFGEISLMKNVKRTATIKAASSCMVLSLQRKQFIRILSRMPEVERIMNEEIDARLAML